MLAEFYLRNFVLIESAQLDFCPGLNIISGETGAGKSLLASSLGIVLGQERFLPEQIRKGCEKASLLAIFRPAEKFIEKIALEFELDLSAIQEDGLIIERIAFRQGRGRITVAGKPVAQAVLGKLGRQLADISSQDESNSLRNRVEQRLLLDRFGNLARQAKAAAKTYNQLKELVEQFRGGTVLREQKRLELEAAKYQLEELEALSPDTQVDLELGERIVFLENTTRLQEFCAQALEQLYESDEAVVSHLGSLAQQAQDLATVPELGEISRQLTGVTESVEEVVRLIRNCTELTATDPNELETAILRQEELKKCARKYNCEIEELSAKMLELQDWVDELAGWGQDIAGLEDRIEKAAAVFLQAGKALTRGRKKIALDLALQIKSYLAKLGMEQADFAILLQPLLRDNESAAELVNKASSAGLEEVCFTIKPNPGENWGNLADTASGGETTRVMLAIKSALAGCNNCELLFFDEIDAGVGGQIAETIAEQLKNLAAKRQVIAITHMAQIAGQGTHHLCVRKEIKAGRTSTKVVVLRGEERVSEIAAMIRGKAANKTTLKQAREILQNWV